MSAAKNQWIHITILSILIYLVVVLKIDTYHMRWWDESMFAVNSYEMFKNGNFFSLYFDGRPDIINSKPPLMVWFQVLFINILGFNEVAVRLPSVIAAAISVFVIFFFSQKRYGSYFAWLSALVLLTSFGYIGYHTARTADSDAMLTLFALLANIYFLKFLENEKTIQIFWFFIFITLGFLTKMYSILLFVPGYVFILVREKKFTQFVRTGAFFRGLAIFIVSVVFFFCLREMGSPGYLHEVFFKDAGRLFTVIEGHDHSWEYYIDNFIFTRFSFWFIILLIGIIFIFQRPKENYEKMFFNLLILSLSYLVIISLSVTKLLWYDMPVYPYLAILTAYSLTKIFENKIDLRTFNKISICLMVFVFSYPYWIMFRKSQSNTIPNGERENEIKERFLFLRSNSKSNLNGLKVYYYGWNGSLLFYKYKFAEKGEYIDLTTSPVFNIGDRVLLSQDSLMDVVASRYQIKVIEQDNDAKVIQIIAPNGKATS
jgi:4-amino-4-deoxy-L-arabinose transferase-like glycosyltransferase